MRPFSFAFSFPAAFLSYAHPRASRSSSRLPSRRASRLMRSVAVVRRVVRRAVSSARLVSLVVSYGRRFALLFAHSRLVSRGVVALRSRAASFCPWHPACPTPPSLRPVGSARSHLLSRSVSSVGGSCPFSCLFPVFAPFRPARRSFLFAYSVSVHVPCRGAWLFVMAMMGAAGACSSHLIRPLMAPARYFAHSLRDSGGRMKSWGTVSCCSPLVPSLLMSHRSPHHVGSPSP